MKHASISTPWGMSDSHTPIADGIDFYSTPGHGGVKLSPERNAKIPAAVRNRSGWYEEDCEWAIVACVFPDEWKASHAGHTDEHKNGIIESAKASLRNWYPDFYEAHFKVKLKPGESHERDKQLFAAEHADDWVVISAVGCGSHDPSIPDGKVRGEATLGGSYDRYAERRVFLIPRNEYQSRGKFGFVVDPDRHVRIDLGAAHAS